MHASGSSILLPRGEDEPVLCLQDIRRYYGDMPGAVCALFDSAKLDVDALRWATREIFLLLEDITSINAVHRFQSHTYLCLAYPQPWDLGNFTGFLLTDMRLCLLSIGFRATKGLPDDAGYTLYYAAKVPLRR